MSSLHVSCWSIVLLSVAQVASAAPSGLNVIPTADVLEPGTLSLELESAGAGAVWGDEASHAQLLQVGLGHGIEAGVDHCLNEPDTWFNLKWRAWAAEEGNAAIALGLEALGAGGGAQPYLTCCVGVGVSRFHSGAIRIDHKTRWMLGYDRPLGKWGTLQLDYLSGSGNAFTYGVAASLGRSLSLTLAHVVGNSQETGNGHLLNLAWSGEW